MQIFLRRQIRPICDKLPKIILYVIFSVTSLIISESNAAGNILPKFPSQTSPTDILTPTYGNASPEQYARNNRWLRSSAKQNRVGLPFITNHPTISGTLHDLTGNQQLEAISGKDSNSGITRLKKVGKQYSGAPNRIPEPPKIQLTKHEVTSTASPTDNKEIGSGASLSDNLLEEFYRTPMFFGTENLTMVTTQVGATAFLPCRIHFIGEGVVSWVRRKDYHLLTVALTQYSSDERFSVRHLKTSEDWALQIRYVQARDAGTYECQVSTHPPTSIFIHLNVIEARAEIIGPSLRYLTPDSTLRLICRVVQSTETVSYLFWYHDHRMINYDKGINITTEADYHYSELTIRHATKKHSGNYSCVPSNSEPASVLVHIFKGDNPAAMHHDHSNSASVVTPYYFRAGSILILAVFLLFKEESEFCSCFIIFFLTTLRDAGLSVRHS